MLSPAKFQAETSAMLEKMPAQSRRVVSKTNEAVKSPDSFRLFATYDGDTVIGAVCFEVSDAYATAAGLMPFACAREFVAALQKEFGRSFAGLEGCDGPPSVVESLTAACMEAFDCSASPKTPVEMMVLDSEPCPTVGIPGMLRAVASRDKLLPILAMWLKDFEKDIENEVYTLQGHAQIVADLSSAAGRGDLFVWEVKEKPVAMVMMGRLRPKTMLCVYTVPHQRGRGYAQAATAAVCAKEWQLTCGMEPIYLSAVHKFGAARVYERVGFRPAGWIHGANFDSKPSDAVVSCEGEIRSPIARSNVYDCDWDAPFSDWDTPFSDFSVPLACH